MNNQRSLSLTKENYKHLINAPCNSAEDAQYIAKETRRIIMEAIKRQTPSYQQCTMCNDLSFIFSSDDELCIESADEPFIDSAGDPSTCLYGSEANYYACFPLAEGFFLDFLDSKNIPIKKAMSILKLGTLYYLPEEEKDELNHDSK